jgi:hypothetical protein
MGFFNYCCTIFLEKKLAYAFNLSNKMTKTVGVIGAGIGGLALSID